MNLKLVSLSMVFAASLQAQAQHVMDVNTQKLGAPVSPTMYGLFFEDINYAADGGLYAELVKNRSFEFPNPFTGWDISGKVSLKDDGPFDKNPHYVRLAPSGHNDKHTMIENHGFFGMGVKGGEEYRFSVWARVPDGGTAKLWIDIVDNATMSDDQKLGNASVEVSGKEWKKYTTVIKPKRTFAKAHLRVWGDSKVTTDVEHISLFPVKTYKGRENGLREDLAKALEDVHPGVFRFPGGCIVEGTDLATRYQWKNTVGPVENRPLNENRWHYTFTNRYFPDYFQTYGLGFFEFFQLCEDIKAEPLPVLSVGLACQFQNGADAHAKMDELQPFIDDCLDLIEFANGPVDSKWGKLRADMGHPAPFNMKYIGIGNEQWDDLYFERLKPFVAAVRAKYPNIKIVGTSGPDSEGKMFEKGWVAMKEQKADLVDEHFYRNEEWFLGTAPKDRYPNCGALRYDSYDRKGPKVFAGEYACHGRGKKWNHYETSLYEAAFMTGIERNADIVEMATYAPLFAHVEGWQWRPDMIWYDNLRMFKSVSYYVQQLYAQNKGTNVLTLLMDKKPVAGQEGQDGLFASSVFDKTTNEVIVKVINTSKQPQPVTLNLQGIKGDRTAETITLSWSGSMDDENTLDQPERITPKAGTFQCVAAKNTLVVSDELPAMSFRLYKVKK
ncbi:alpha-L-arabinofuranosidase C-terminal domain-containing protein [uncultured Prevotella sp.]|uniref:alpha-L-arabinofuranosidase C-terminal domain-containing protein n=1 Tax=uncultured Prevotella sp. TaxID=159272 RepID=UPI0025D73AB1|nr:alpha-L-arabinofuranosidase C-terminal domain-containing protein [uncultured Prevotella sp.]